MRDWTEEEIDLYILCFIKGAGTEKKEHMDDFLVVEDVDGTESDLTLSVRKLASQLNQPVTQEKVCVYICMKERWFLFQPLLLSAA